MSCNIRLVYGNAFYHSAITSPTTIDGNLRHLLDENRARTVQCDRDETLLIKCQMLSKQRIDTVALPMCKLSPQAVVIMRMLDGAGAEIDRREFNQNSALASTTVDDFIAGSVPFCGDTVEPWPDPLIWWRDEVAEPAQVWISIYDPDNPAGIIDAGMIFAGEYLKLNKNFSYGSVLKPLTDGELTRLKSGYAARVKSQMKARAWSLSFEGMPPEDEQAFYNAENLAPNQPLLVAGYPQGENWQQLQYRFMALTQSSGGYTHNRRNKYTTQRVLWEV